MITVRREPLYRLKDRWNRLTSLNPMTWPYQNYEMVCMINKYYLPFIVKGREFPEFYSFSENGITIAIAPMARRYGEKYKYVNFGAAATIAVKDFIYAADMGVEKMIECVVALKEKLKSIKFYDVLESSLLYQALSQLGEECGVHEYVTIPFEDLGKQYGGGIVLIINHLQNICGKISELLITIWTRII